jgi:hypothetical protein
MGKVKRLAVLFLLSLSLVWVTPNVEGASKRLEGRWLFSITTPEAPESQVLRTFTVTLEASPRVNGLHGRTRIIDDQQRVVGGVWRQSGKKVSIVYELPCGSGDSCASLVLLGKIKNKVRIKKGDVIVMWDVPNDRNHAQFETSVGDFSADRLE